MSKVKLLLDVAEDMRHLADSLQAVADSMTGEVPGDTTTIPDAPAGIPPSPAVPVVTLEQVRAVLAEKSGDGKRQAVKELLYRFDAGKLSGVKPEDYAALLEEARKL